MQILLPGPLKVNFNMDVNYDMPIKRVKLNRETKVESHAEHETKHTSQGIPTARAKYLGSM